MIAARGGAPPGDGAARGILLGMPEANAAMSGKDRRSYSAAVPKKQGRLTLTGAAAATAARRLGLKPQRDPPPSRDQVNALQARLAGECAGIAAFDRGVIRPLKLGIHKDIAGRFPDVPLAVLRSFLARYCRQQLYLARSTAGAIRVDLDGQAAGVVTEAEAQNAAASLRGFAEARGREDP